MVSRKGSYFFVIDAFIAGTIIIAAIVIIFSRFFSQSPTTPAFYTAEDFFLLIETTSLRDFDSSLVRDWVANGTINDSSLAILDQMALFVAKNDFGNARELAGILGAGISPSVQYEIIAEGQSLYSSVPDSANPLDKDDASVFFSSKRIVLLRKQPSDVYPPVLVEVQTWQ